MQNIALNIESILCRETHLSSVYFNHFLFIPYIFPSFSFILAFYYSAAWHTHHYAAALHYPIFSLWEKCCARAAPVSQEEFNPLALTGGGLDDLIPLSDNLLSLSTDNRAGCVCVCSVDCHIPTTAGVSQSAGCIFSLVVALALALRRVGCAWQQHR